MAFFNWLAANSTNIMECGPHIRLVAVSGNIGVGISFYRGYMGARIMLPEQLCVCKYAGGGA